LKGKIQNVLQRAAAFALKPTLKEVIEGHAGKLIEVIEGQAGKLIESQAGVERRTQMLLALQFHELAGRPGWRPDFEEVGFNQYSTTYEDGILLCIFSVIGTAGRRLVDIGAGRVIGSNSANLIVHHGFTGLLIDGDPAEVESCRRFYTGHPETKVLPPKLVSVMVDAENVNRVLEGNGFTGEVDLLSIDIDGMDYWIWKAIEVIRPRVVLVEYQDILGPERSWTVPYKRDFRVRDCEVNRRDFNYCGASLRAFVGLGRQKGYRLVGCNRGGWNAFFVKAGLGEACLPEVPPEICLRSEWNRMGMENRFPLVKDMPWQEV
jgi:hypothetical protein